MQMRMARHHFFADSRLACNEDRHIRMRDALDDFRQATHFRIERYESAGRFGSVIQHLINGRLQRTVVKRLHQKIAGSRFHSVDDGSDVSHS